MLIAFGNEHLKNDFDLAGSDETFTAALGFGIDSAVGSTYNFMPQVSLIFTKLTKLNFHKIKKCVSKVSSKVFQRLQQLHLEGNIDEVSPQK